MSILLEELNEAFNLNEERVNNKEYLFRGISDSNYSAQQESALKSRFFSYEITEDVSKFGDIVVFELLDDSQIFNYEESVFDFCDEYDLLDVHCAELENLYGISTLEEADGMSFHDEYHSYQIVATDFLENNTDYKGIVWYEYMDDINYQVQI